MQRCNCVEATSEAYPVHWKVRLWQIIQSEEFHGDGQLDTPYNVGTMEVLCPSDAICDATIKNIPGARAAESLDSM